MTTLVALRPGEIEQHVFDCACGLCDDNKKSHTVNLHQLELSQISDEPLAANARGPSPAEAIDAAVALCKENGWRPLPVQAYIATVQVVVFAESSADACDWFSETLRAAPDLVDWQYFRPENGVSPVDGNGLCYPSPIDIPADYSEGCAFESEKC